ncbi:MAG: PilZ domain-containing protein [Bacteriovoracaceae bacterium]|nr:PilZ domain-containing protein [Bacteriovoracaceae bacterium]
MKVQRNFPRYEVIHLRPKLIFPSFASTEFYIKDVSLGGIQIFSPIHISLNSFNEVSFSLGSKEPIRLNISQVWKIEEPVVDEKYKDILKDKFSEVSFRSGFSLKFYDLSDFQKWQKLMYALHQHQKSKN